ncbi:MAG: DUF4129 domain-containing protein [Bacteroidetes bacterium]|nr:DUF4129 domain-containing protein [Bacteroidota bacterium]
MRSVIKTLLLLIFSCQLFFIAKAQDNNNGTEENKNAEENVLYRNDIFISPDSIQAWKADRKFAYIKNLDSLLKEAEKAEMEREVINTSRKAPSPLQLFFDSAVVQFILWAVIIMVLLFIVYKLFVSQGLFTKNKTDAVVKESGEITKEMTDPADYDAMIRQSYTKGDYRMAVRFLFLKTLRLLAERGYIQYETDKTNYRYVQEIKADKKQSFASLVLDYEYVWYGHIDLVKDQYEQVEKKYQSFLNKV